MGGARVGQGALAVVALAPCVALAGALVAALVDGAAAYEATPRREATAFFLSASLWGVGVALLLAVPVGVALGAWLARAQRSTPASRVVDSSLDALAAVPAGLIGAAAAVVLWTAGVGGAAALIAVLALVVLPGVAARAAEAFGRVSRDRVEAALALGASRAQAFRHVTVTAVWRPIAAGALRAAARAAGEGVAVLIAWRIVGGEQATGAFFPLTLGMYLGGDAPRGAEELAAALVALAVGATLGAAALEGSGVDGER